MYGVVLWADERDSKAVIWCEDHGHLAFYSAAEHSPMDGLNLDPGDLIEFDVKEHKNLRLARNPIVVSGDFSSGLAQKLKATAQLTGAQDIPEDTGDSRTKDGSAEVVSFQAYRQARQIN